MANERIETIPVLPPRPADSHKGLFGTILVIAGSRGMAGAAGLCGASCLRSGAGLVRIATAAEVQPTVASFEPSYMTYPIANDAEGLITFDAAMKVVDKFLPRTDVLAVGPGLGQSEDLRRLVLWIVESIDLPIVLDADGLNCLVGQTDAVRHRSSPMVITPHLGEFARLTGKPVAEIEADRQRHAEAFAREFPSLVVVLKGAGTVVTDGDRTFINTTGNPGMATAGVGDVLTGVIAALIGQKLGVFEAAQLGVYVHGLAGDVARDQNGEVGMIAGDLVDALPDAFEHLPN